MADRDDAIAFLRGIMDDDQARKADRIKAAEAILRADSAAPSAPGALHDLDDGELLARARGVEEGGIPPREGPKAPGVAAVPSNEQGEQSYKPSASGVKVKAASPLAGPDHVPRGTNPLNERGPKEDPSPRGAPGSTRNTHKAALERAVAKRKAQRTKKGAPISPPTADGTQNGPADYIDPLS
jgi:hypothetical protein